MQANQLQAIGKTLKTIHQSILFASVRHSDQDKVRPDRTGLFIGSVVELPIDFPPQAF